jgi:hypothetical protein
VVDGQDDLDELREPDSPVARLDRQGRRRTDGEDPGLGRVDDGRELLDAEHAEVGDGQGAAFQLGLLQAAGPGPGCEILDRRGEIRQRPARDRAHDRGHQPSLAGHRHGDVGGVKVPYRVWGPADVHVRHIHHGLARGLHDEIIDGDLEVARGVRRRAQL